MIRASCGAVAEFRYSLVPARDAGPVSSRASLVQTSAALRPFRSAFGSSSKGGETLVWIDITAILRAINAKIEKLEPARSILAELAGPLH
jgi:hypothetical protein